MKDPSNTIMRDAFHTTCCAIKIKIIKNNKTKIRKNKKTKKIKILKYV